MLGVWGRIPLFFFILLIWGGWGGSFPSPPPSEIVASADLDNAIAFYTNKILYSAEATQEPDLWKGLCVALRRAENFYACLRATQTLLRLDPSPLNRRDAGLLLSLVGRSEASARQLEVSEDARGPPSAR